MGHWLKKLSILSLLGFPLAVIGTRIGLFDFRNGLSLVAGTLVLAALVFLLSVVVGFPRKSNKLVNMRAARRAGLISLIPLLGIGSQLLTANSLPQIHNISTDIVDPPRFSKIVQIRTKAHNPLEYDAAKLARLQQLAYPEVQTLYTSLSHSEAHKRVVVLTEALGWEMVDQNATLGIVEATDTTAMWGFKDDIVIRVRSNSNQTKNNQTAVDLHSVSRVGQSDLGANAKRIQLFLDAFKRHD